MVHHGPAAVVVTKRTDRHRRCARRPAPPRPCAPISARTAVDPHLPPLHGGSGVGHLKCFVVSASFPPRVCHSKARAPRSAWGGEVVRRCGRRGWIQCTRETVVQCIGRGAFVLTIPLFLLLSLARSLSLTLAIKTCSLPGSGCCVYFLWSPPLSSRCVGPIPISSTMWLPTRALTVPLIGPG
jgi:hypothetical protein